MSRQGASPKPASRANRSAYPTSVSDERAMSRNRRNSLLPQSPSTSLHNLHRSRLCSFSKLLRPFTCRVRGVVQVLVGANHPRRQKEEQLGLGRVLDVSTEQAANQR